jgi:hypothetical protein
MRKEDKFENIVRKDLDVRASDGTYNRMRDVVLSAHRPARTTGSAATLIFTGRTIMRNPIARLAVAAAILIALGLGVWAFISTGSHSSVVWAQVADRVDASGGFIYRTRTIQKQANWDQPHEFASMTYNSPGHGVRIEGIEGDASDSYINYEEGTQVILNHAAKHYIQRTLPPRPAGAEAEPPAGAMAKAMILPFTAGAYKEIGRRTLDGVQAEGIETHGFAGFGGNFQVDSQTSRLWVSVETGYPVLVEHEVVGNNGTIEIKTILDQFQWDVALDPAQFKTVIPPGYRRMEMRMREDGAATLVDASDDQ